jgi:hypothetical protein
MGNPCWLRVHTRPFDVERVRQALDLDPDDEGREGGPSLSDPSSNYGKWTERRELADEGVAFYGDQGAGQEFGPMVFAAYGRDYVEVNADEEGQPVVVVPEDGPIRPEEIEEVRRYYAVRALVSAAIRVEVESVACQFCGKSRSACNGGGLPEVGPDGEEWVPPAHDFTAAGGVS